MKAIAALFTNTSRAPTSAENVSANAAIEAASEMSHCMNRAFGDASCFTAASPSSLFRQASTTTVQVVRSCLAIS